MPVVHKMYDFVYHRWFLMSVLMCAPFVGRFYFLYAFFSTTALGTLSDDYPFDYRGLVAIWDESQRRDRLGYDKVCLLPDGYGAESVTHSHCISGIDCTCIERLFWGEPHLYTS